MAGLKPESIDRNSGVQQYWALAAYALCFLVFTHVESHAGVNACRGFYSEVTQPIRATHNASKPVFKIPRSSEEIFEEGQDGLNHFNLFEGNIYSKDTGVKHRLLPETQGTAETVMEVIGTSPNKKSVFEFRTGQGLFLYRSRIGGFPLYQGRANSTGIRLKVSSWDPNAEITIKLRPFDAENTIEVFTFKAGTEPTDIYIPWSKFKKVFGVAKTPFWDPRSGKTITDESFVISVNGTEIPPNGVDKTKSQFGIRLHGPIIFERDLMADPKLMDLVVNFDYSIFGSMPLALAGGRTIEAMDHWNFPKDGRFKKLEAQSNDRRVLTEAIHHMHNREFQEKAAWMTDAEVVAALKKEGVDIVYFDEKFTIMKVPFFFGSEGPLNYISPRVENDQRTSKYLMNHKHTPRLPGERGEFGQEHGELSHGRQLLAMLMGLNKKDKETLKAIVGGMFGSNGRRWAIWDILFDAGGNTFPNAPRFWRDLTEEMQRRRFGSI